MKSFGQTLNYGHASGCGGGISSKRKERVMPDLSWEEIGLLLLLASGSLSFKTLLPSEALCLLGLSHKGLVNWSSPSGTFSLFPWTSEKMQAL